MSRPGPTVAAVLNTSPDMVDLLRSALEQAGIIVVSALSHQIRQGAIDIETFVRQHDPDVIVYDIAPPYEANWRLFQHLCGMPELRKRKFVLTSTNTAHVEKLASTDERIYEVVGKPIDLDAIVRAVKESARSRPTR
jgi:CheY-like chemotaxis protein